MFLSKYLFRNIPRKLRNNWLSLLLSISSMVTTTGLELFLQNLVIVNARPSSDFAVQFSQMLASTSSSLAELSRLAIILANVLTNASSDTNALSPNPSKLIGRTRYCSDNRRQTIKSVVVFPYCRARLMVKYSPVAINSSIALKRFLLFTI